MRRTVRLLASMGTAMLLASAVVLVTVVASMRSAVAAAERPNIVLVVTDDLTKKDYFDLGRNLSSFTSGGTFFYNAFVTTALCCPSRASTLTGLYAHNHHITQHIDPGTGYEQYHAEGYDQKDLPVWLQDSGYETGLVGKYLNKYQAQEDGIPAGWTDWYGANSPTTSWTLNENGSLKTYPQDPTAPGYEPWEDVMGDKAVEFVGKAHASGQPFFLWYGTHAPHSPELIPPRDKDKVGTWPAYAPPSFNERDVSDKPKWVRDQSLLSSAQRQSLKHERQAPDLDARRLAQPRAAEGQAQGDRRALQHLPYLHLGQRLPPRTAPPGCRQDERLRGGHARTAGDLGTGRRLGRCEAHGVEH
jgi:N-acetylglucosamine-6-sulfatase